MKFRVNGDEKELDASPTRSLLDVLREDLFLTGTKRGCDGGECGACTVIMNGKAVNSCLVIATELDGSEITTIEGLAQEGKDVHLLQQAFVEKGAVQCGFCTPGMIMTAKAFLDLNPNPTEEEVRNALSGNLCRCTGYTKIVEAVLTGAEEIRRLKH
ncbi:MAG TPA: (2Fe-2S)-binding protein [Terriglobales bacterium]|nr:(2Fe-2S)-binding protein [Terriglobales bacterium]